MEIKKKYKIPIYHGTLIVIISDDLEKINEKYKLFDKDELNIDEYDGLVVRKSLKGYTQYYVLLEPGVKLSVLVHESKHAVNRIFYDRSIDLDIINDEAECYLLGWVFSKVYQTFKLYGNK